MAHRDGMGSTVDALWMQGFLNGDIRIPAYSVRDLPEIGGLTNQTLGFLVGS